MQSMNNALELLDSDQVDYDRLHHYIVQDTALSDQVLAIANSSFYGMSGKVSSIKESCIILGRHTLRHIFTASSGL